MRRRLRVLDNFYLDNEIIFESPFRVGARDLCFHPGGGFLLCSSNHCFVPDILSNQARGFCGFG